MEFQVAENVFLKESPMKEVMRFGKKGKMSYDILIPLRLFECVEQVANRLVLPPNFCGVYLIFDESMFRGITVMVTISLSGIPLNRLLLLILMFVN